MTRYVLPDLAYDYSALEPHISGEIMELHHDKHHKKYVDGANQALEKLAKARMNDDFAAIAALERQLAFNVSGHVLHSIFWCNLSPEGGGEPFGDLAEQVRADFGSFESMKHQLVKAASTIMGSGWATLVWDPVLKRLATAQVHDHQSDIAQASVPLLVIDAWEHAYYLQYKTEKDKFFSALWNLWSWDDVRRRFENARALDVALESAATSESQQPAIH